MLALRRREPCSASVCGISTWLEFGAQLDDLQ
jgi:hypothetical protein